MTPTQVELGNFNKPSPETESKEDAKSVNMGQFLKEVRTEFSKISWPSREQVAREFFSVLFLVCMLTGIIFLIDKTIDVLTGVFSGRPY